MHDGAVPVVGPSESAPHQAGLVVCTRETANDPRLTLVSDARHRLATGSFARGSQWVTEEMRRLMQT